MSVTCPFDLSSCDSTLCLRASCGGTRRHHSSEVGIRGVFPASVDEQIHTGDVGGVIAGEKSGGACDVIEELPDRWEVRFHGRKLTGRYELARPDPLSDEWTLRRLGDS